MLSKATRMPSNPDILAVPKDEAMENYAMNAFQTKILKKAQRPKLKSSAQILKFYKKGRVPSFSSSPLPVTFFFATEIQSMYGLAAKKHTTRLWCI